MTQNLVYHIIFCWVWYTPFLVCLEPDVRKDPWCPATNTRTATAKHGGTILPLTNMIFPFQAALKAQFTWPEFVWFFPIRTMRKNTIQTQDIFHEQWWFYVFPGKNHGFPPWKTTIVHPQKPAPDAPWTVRPGWQAFEGCKELAQAFKWRQQQRRHPQRRRSAKAAHLERKGARVQWDRWFMNSA